MPVAPTRRRVESSPRDRRESAWQRGYDTQWKNFRRWFLQENPLCVDCLNRGTYEAANEVHHKVKVKHDPELRLVPTNCMALCKRCHSKRTRRGE